MRDTDYAEYYLHTVLADGEPLTGSLSNLKDNAMSDKTYEELSTTQHVIGKYRRMQNE